MIFFSLFTLILFILHFPTEMEGLLKEMEAIIVPIIEDVNNNGREKLIEVKTQIDFDNIQNLILDAQKEGYKNINISIDSGIFFYHFQHILLRNQNNNETTIRIRGNRTIIVSRLADYDGSGFDYKKIYLTPTFENFQIWSKFYEAQGCVEVVNDKTNICRVFNSALLDQMDLYPGKSRIQLTQWYKCPIYNVTKVENGWIYFVAEGLELIKDSDEYNVNSDKYVSKKTPMFRLCNIGYQEDRLLYKVKGLRECRESQFLYMDQCHYRKVEISNIIFCGNCLGNPFIKLMTTSSEIIDIHDCEFNSMMSMCIYAYNTDNFLIRNNRFINMYNNAVYCFDHGKTPIIKDNVFINTGLSCKNVFAITCRGDEGFIVNNKISNFGYGAISIGHYTDEDNENRMIVEGNNIFYTSDNIGSPLIDGGAIYLYPNAVNCIVRYNRIDNIFGRGSNRGIYCDNGSFGFSLYGNIVTRINNSYCIDSWRFRHSSKNNTNNLIMLNIVDGKCRFEGSEKKANNCILGPNFIISDNGAPYANIMNNYSTIGNDIFLSINTNNLDLASIYYRNKNIFRRYKILKGVKQFIK